MKPMKKKDFVKFLKKNGAKFKRQGKGDHEIYVKGDKSGSVPDHKVVSPGVIRNVCQSLEIDYRDVA